MEEIKMQAVKYLERIGLSCDRCEVSLDFLKKIQEAHIYSVPYENIDILNGVPISLKTEDIYDKIVERKRGGYCFELNALLSWLLSELGYSVESYFARFWRAESTTPLRRHRVLGVKLGEDRYIVDVGIGSPAPRFPLILKEGLVQEGFGESYRFEYEKELGWVLYELTHGEWKRYFSFTEEWQFDIDFIQPSFYCEKHPDSIFNKGLIVAMKTPNGRKCIDKDCFKRFVGRELVEIKEGLSSDEIKEILSLEFGIVV